MRRLYFGLLVIFCCTSSAQDVGTRDAEKDLIYYSADIIKADLIEESAELKGNVKILFEDYELSAKNAYISKKNNTLKAWEEVSIESDDSYIQADEVHLNYKTQQGNISGVRLTSGQLLLEAKSIEKLSENEYLAEDAKFTTCVTCPPGWRIKGKKIKTNIKKYVEISGGRFQILNQTVLPLPHLVLPLNTRRKTGFLNPELESSSRTGLGLTVPYFWAIDPHRDLTLSPILYSDEKNGFKTSGAKILGEYNQWLSSKSRLKLESAYMYDDSYINDDKVNEPTERWFLEYENFFVLPRGVVQKSDFTLVKDRNYLSDFRTEVDGWGKAALENKFSISKASERSFFSSEIVYYINLLVAETSSNENLSIHKLPEISYSFVQTPFFYNRLLFKSNLVYTNFQRNLQSFDEVTTNTSDPEIEKDVDTQGDGVFDASKDLIRTGHRLRLHAEVSAPFQVARTFDVMPSLTYRDSYYKFNLDKSKVTNQTVATPYSPYAFSRYLEFATSIKTEFSKVYEPNLKHKVIPEVVFKAGSPINQSENIFFDSQGSLPYHRQYQPITDQDFFEFDHGVQFDYWDRFFRAEVVEFNLTNIFIKKHKEDLVTYYDQPFFFKLSQSYDFRNARLAASPDPWSNLNATLKLRTKNYINHTQASYFYKAQRTNVTSRNTFIYLPGRHFSLEYSDFITVDEKGALTTNHTKNLRTELSWEFPSLKFSGYLNYSILEKKYQDWGTNITYTPRGNCWGVGLRLWQFINSPDQDLNYKVNLHFNFGADTSARRSLLTI